MGQETSTTRILGERSVKFLNSLGDATVFDVPSTLLEAWYNNAGICKTSPKTPILIVEKARNPGSVTFVQIRDGERDLIIDQIDLAPGEVLGVTHRYLSGLKKPHLTRSLREEDLDFLNNILDIAASNS